MLQLKALVIDDSRVMRNMVMQNLLKARLAEFEFVEASDGADGLTKFNPAEFDVCFVDWNMPNMTGIDFVRQARTVPGAENTIMVMVTSEKSMGKIEEALDSAGASAYICKPFTPEDLDMKLRKLFDELEAKLLKEQQPAPSGGLLGKLFG
ncbi:MAG TPA: response regulator [Gemmataceae bacterium]|nr:response regulator [Gemmataceae bacterium]